MEWHGLFSVRNERFFCLFCLFLKLLGGFWDGLVSTVYFQFFHDLGIEYTNYQSPHYVLTNGTGRLCGTGKREGSSPPVETPH